MLEMLSRQIIPACITYSNKLAEGVAVKKSIGIDAAEERDMVQQLTEQTAALSKTRAALQKAVDDAPAGNDIQSLQHRAEYYRDTVIPVMQQCRTIADGLESMVDENDWPLPTYGRMLFYV